MLKKGFRYFVAYKDAKKIDIYAYFFEKWAYIEKTLMRINTSFFNKRWWIIKKNIITFGKRYP